MGEAKRRREAGDTTNYGEKYGDTNRIIHAGAHCVFITTPKRLGEQTRIMQFEANSTQPAKNLIRGAHEHMGMCPFEEHSIALIQFKTKEDAEKAYKLIAAKLKGAN